MMMMIFTIFLPQVSLPSMIPVADDTVWLVCVCKCERAYDASMKSFVCSALPI